MRVYKTGSDATGEYTEESLFASWYNSNGTYESDVSIFPTRVEALSSQISKDLPGYKKILEGPAQVNKLKAYEFHFTGVFQDPQKGEVPYWGRVLFIPPGAEGEKNGVALIMIVSSLAGNVHSEEDVGIKGDMAMILDSFRLRKQ